MTLTVTSLVEKNIAGASSSSKLAFSQGADLVECRLDHLDDLGPDKVRELRREILGPAMATLRSVSQGGKSSLQPAQRADILRTALESNFEYVDLELTADGKLLKALRSEDWESGTVVSCHLDRPGSQAQVERLLREASALGDIAKVAMPCETAADALMLCETGLKLSQKRGRYVLLGMGAQGQVTRALADRIGSFMAYSCLEGKEAAPGQLDTITQCNLVNSPKLVLGLVGHPVGHSVSKPMQEAAIAAMGRAGTYLPMDFEPGTFDRRALRTILRLGFDGLNVTIPHKEKACQLCDELLPAAEATKAVNTIQFRKNKFVGENTDVKGFSSSIDGKIYILPGSKALLLGAGGVARAIAYVLSERGANLTIVDIDDAKAKVLAKACRARAVPFKGLLKLDESFDFVVNCSPVGMKGQPGNPVKKELLRQRGVFFDVVYNPSVTEAMETAREAGVRVFGGLEMLVQQGAESFRLWTGLEPNVYAMREAARRALE